MIVKGTSHSGGNSGVADSAWTENIAEQWKKASEAPERHHTLDLSQIEFIPLFEWVSTVAMLERLLSNPVVHELQIDLYGGKQPPLPGEVLSPRARGIASFLESLGTTRVLNKDHRIGQIGYRWLEQKTVQAHSHYTRRDGTETALLRLTRIDTREHCLQFIDQHQIRNWREEMNLKALDSPLFEFDEIWRVFCHELAVNIWEHGYNQQGIGSGFIAGRVIQPAKSNTGDSKAFPKWCDKSYPGHIRELFEQMPDGFLELCVSDSGTGVVETLGASYRDQAGLGPDAVVNPEDVLAFAFDEFGTRKSRSDSWATERHALGRILQLVAKYGGALTLRSGGAEVVYRSEDGYFVPRRGHLGYDPYLSRPFAPHLDGAHFQLILPLVPLVPKPLRTLRPSLLLSSMPEGYSLDQKHPTGHLVVLETLGFCEPCIGDVAVREFMRRCEALAKRLANEHPRNEAVVLDFSELKWRPVEFETLLHLLQNVLQSRPVLLVEIDPDLARQVLALEDESAETHLREAGIGSIPDDEKRVFGGISEQTFLESYRAVHSTLLGLDAEGRQHIFGLPHRNYQGALLDLIDRPKRIEEMSTLSGIESRVLRVILNRINPLFSCDLSGRWTTIWNAAALRVQATRAMSRHFEEVSKRCAAWRGGVTEGKNILFNLPWQGEWVDDFFECARILSRERYADEAAQRLIYRLETCLLSEGKTLDAVKVLACLTAPSILLASAIHRCWPHGSTRQRPAIADLGPYLMLNPDGPRPQIADGEGFVVVQDVYNDGRNSNRIIKWLEEQHPNTVLCVLSLIRLELATERPRLANGFRDLGPIFTPIQFEVPEPLDGKRAVPLHAMVRLVRPIPLSVAPDVEADDHNLYWVEPRTLRPFRYSLLRGERRAEERKPRARLYPFFRPLEGRSLLSAGHYSYGEKHYAVAVDIQRVVEDSPIGDQLAPWLADVCLGVPPNHRQSAEWESPEGRALSGDVFAVLMPLHSRIHYIWPRVANLLAQFGRLQPMWLLDATLFLGHGPTYRLPHQFEVQLRDRFNELVESEFERLAVQDPSVLRAIALHEREARLRLRSDLEARIKRPSPGLIEEILDFESAKWSKLRKLAEQKLKATRAKTFKEFSNADRQSPIRILILDDAAHTAQTANTIVGDLTRALDKFSKPVRELGIQPPQLIAWVRYFVIFNQLNRTRSDHWQKLRTIGGDFRIPFVFEDFGHLPGVPIYSVTDCPSCADLTRFQRLVTAADRHGSLEASDWAKGRLQAERPIVVDSPGFDRRHSRFGGGKLLRRELNLLPRFREATEDEFAGRYRVRNIDVAIWRFYELMYYSHPPSDVLKSLARDNAWPLAGEEDLVNEYERFRWTVFEWCLRNWPRLIADGAREAFMSCARIEVESFTPLAERLCDGLASHAKDQHIPAFLGFCLETLNRLESDRPVALGSQHQNSRRAWRLFRAISLFLLNLPREELTQVIVDVPGNGAINMLEYMGHLATTSAGDAITYLPILYARFTRPVGHADPRWALRTAAEILFRGRDPDDLAVGTHRLLPQLLKEVMDQLDRDDYDRLQHEEPRSLLLGSLSQFLAALDDLKAYATEAALGTRLLQQHGRDVLDWLTSTTASAPRDALIHLRDQLLPESDFCRDFKMLFQPRICELEPHLSAETSKLKARREADVLLSGTSSVGVLNFEFSLSEDVGSWRVLTHVQRLCHFLVNWAIDPIKENPGSYCSRIEIRGVPSKQGAIQLCFRILTNFRSLSETNELTIGGRNYEAESSMLRTFGAELSEEWKAPSKIDSPSPLCTDYNSFTAAFDLFVPVGFMPR